MTVALLLCLFILTSSFIVLCGRVEKLEDIERTRKAKGD